MMFRLWGELTVVMFCSAMLSTAKLLDLTGERCMEVTAA